MVLDLGMCLHAKMGRSKVDLVLGFATSAALQAGPDLAIVASLLGIISMGSSALMLFRGEISAGRFPCCEKIGQELIVAIRRANVRRVWIGQPTGQEFNMDKLRVVAQENMGPFITPSLRSSSPGASIGCLFVEHGRLHPAGTGISPVSLVAMLRRW